MGRPARLTKAYVDSIDAPGRFSDGRGGNGLSLRVRRSRDGVGLTRAWEQRVHAGGQTLTLGLGGYAAVGISEARRQAAENVQKIKARFPRVSALDRLLVRPRGSSGLGPDPTAPVTIQQARPAPLFREMVEEYIDTQRLSWRQGSKTEAQTRSLLDRFVLPKVGDLPVDQVTSAHLLDLLSPIWHTRAESAKKVKRHLAGVLKNSCEASRHEITWR